MTNDHHFRREDRAAHWRRVADHVSAQPDEAFSLALGNLERWERWGRVHPEPLREWRDRIEAARKSPAALDEFVAWLALPNHDAEPLKSCSPFAGLLPAGEPAAP
ncbi:MAG: hypothetical protein WD342_15020 [Verrucomicrobiales bacterium]